MLTAAALEPDSTANAELCGVPERNGVWLCQECSSTIATAQQQVLQKPLLHEESKLRDGI